MRLNNLITDCYELANEYKLQVNKVLEMVEFQDYKRVFRTGESDLKLSYNVVKRYFRLNSPEGGYDFNIFKVGKKNERNNL